MVRRTKEASQETRRAIVDAARSVFDRSGVAHTSLEEVAAEAGVTRGAIYWHFANKADLFNALRDEAHLPLMHLGDLALGVADETFDPLNRVENFINVVIDRIGGDKNTEQIFRIANFKCEYVDEFASDFDMAARKFAELQGKLTKVYRQAQRKRLLRTGLSPALAASDTLVFMTGLVRMWLFDGDGLLVRKQARALIAGHVAAKRQPIAPRSGTRASGTKRRVPLRPVSRSAAK